MYDILSLRKSTLLTAGMILLCTNKPEDSHSPFRRRNAHSSAGLVPLCPTKSNLTFSAISDSALYRLLTFHVPNLLPLSTQLLSLIRRIRPSPRLYVAFRTKLFLLQEVVSLTPNSEAGRSPIVGCLRQLILYICSYLPLLTAVSSIRSLKHVQIRGETGTR
jgi:hypothetical protein